MTCVKNTVYQNKAEYYSGRWMISYRLCWLKNYFGKRSFKCRGVVVFKLGAYNFVFAAPIVLFFAAAAICFCIRGKTNAVISTPTVMERKGKVYGACHICNQQ